MPSRGWKETLPMVKALVKALVKAMVKALGNTQPLQNHRGAGEIAAPW
jgi:hypothetical protein